MRIPFLAPIRHLLLVQPRVGIGDMIWHLPHIRALAARAHEVTLLARRRSLARELVGPEDGVGRIVFVERGQWDAGGRHQGNLGFLRLVRDLRALGCDAAAVMTRSRMLTLAVAGAGIPRRYGYGLGSQRFVLTGPFLPAAARRLHPYDQASRWLELLGVPLDAPEPKLPLAAADRAAASPFGTGAAVLGIGASDAWKNWGAKRFAGLARAMLDAGWPRVLLVGGAAEQALAAAIATELSPDADRVQPVLGLNLRTLAAMLAGQGLYVGNDTAALNIAAAVSLRSYGLFGATPVLRHSPHIVPVVPPGGMSATDGMARLTLELVLDAMRADRGRLGP